MNITGKYIFIAHGKQLSVEKYDYDFNFESLSFFIPAGYVLENPQNIPSSSLTSIPQILCENRLNLDRISKVPIDGKLKLRKMAFTASEKDKLPGNEIFYHNAGLYYCDSRTLIKILNWEDLKRLNFISFKNIFKIINEHAYNYGINPSTTALFLYTCRSSCVEPKKGHIAPTLMPLKGPEKKVGVGGPSIKQIRNALNVIEVPSSQSQSQTQSQTSERMLGGNNIVFSNEIMPLSNTLNVDESLFYKYNFNGGKNKSREKRISKSKSKNKSREKRISKSKKNIKRNKKYKKTNKNNKLIKRNIK